MKHHLDNPQQLLRSLQACEQLAHNLRLTKGARAINDAINAVGWEMADKAEKKAKRSVAAIRQRAQEGGK